MEDKNPSAFPISGSQYRHTAGMTLRDYFAAKAMQAVYAKNWAMFMDETYEHPDEVVEGTAKDAYELADAMMKERNQ